MLGAEDSRSVKNGLKEASVEAGGQLGGRREGGNLGQGGGAGLEGGGWSQKVPVTRTQQDLGMRGLWAEWKRHFKNMAQVSRCLVSSVVSEPYLARLHIEYGEKNQKTEDSLGTFPSHEICPRAAGSLGIPQNPARMQHGEAAGGPAGG